MRIQIFDNAKRDLVDGFAFYEAQSTGVGQYFLDSLYSDIDSLTLFAGIHPKKFGDFRWLLSKRFPYAIYYTVSARNLLFAPLAKTEAKGRFWDRSEGVWGERGDGQG